LKTFADLDKNTTGTIAIIPFFIVKNKVETLYSINIKLFLREKLLIAEMH
jgi:hypothetical protein